MFRSTSHILQTQFSPFNPSKNVNPSEYEEWNIKKSCNFAEMRFIDLKTIPQKYTISPAFAYVKVIKK